MRKAKIGARHVDFYVMKSKEVARGGQVDESPTSEPVVNDRKDFIYF